MFQKAERKKVKLKIAITGPSGSGKTYGALELASGIGSKIALIDTENGSASLYSDRFNFDTLVINPPYTIDKYVAAIKAAVNAEYDVLIIDSISHAWAAEGGLLSKKEALDARGGNSYTNWGSITKEHEQFKAMLLNSDIHLVCTMRSKQDYIMEQNDKGKQAPRKVGLAPIQRDGMEYEFTTVLDAAMDHNVSVSKDRTGLFDGKLFKISQETGKIFMEWLSTGKDGWTKPHTTTYTVSVPDTNDVIPQFLSEYVVEFGKFKGKRLTEITDSEIASYMEYLTSEAMKQNKEIKGAVRDFLDFGYDYLEFKKKQSNILDEPLPH